VSSSTTPSDARSRAFKGTPGCRVYLFRHGETANAHQICMNGHFDVALSETGMEQAGQLASAMKDQPLRAVYSSDLQRTYQGARLIAEHHKLDPMAFPELRELSFGKWEGKSLAELNEKYPGEMDKRLRQTELFRADGGETFQELNDRVIPKFLEITDSHPNDTIAFVCHGGVNRAILAHLLGFPIANLFRISQHFAAVNIIQFYEDQVMVELLNGTWQHIT
jgi:alpha-ribazole phosphatase